MRINASLLSSKIKDYLGEKGVNQEQLAQSCKLHQSQVSRMISGHTYRLSPGVKKVCDKIKLPISKISEASLQKNNSLDSALRNFIQGSQNREKALVKLLNTMTQCA
jgi:hypothetical protein